MSVEDKKKINVEVSKECWKKLKILSIQKDVTLVQLVTDMLERYTQGKKFEHIGVETE